MKLPDLLKPQATLIHPSIPDVHIPKAALLFHKWTGEPPEDDYRKPILEYCGEMVNVRHGPPNSNRDLFERTTLFAG